MIRAAAKNHDFVAVCTDDRGWSMAALAANRTGGT
jgi:AICAR transformylase/IMP cyclohydrolase PurH